MIKDNRPYYIKRFWYRLIHFYVRRKISPQLRFLGSNPFIVKPWHIEIFGWPISIGHNITLLGCSDKKTRLTVWSADKNVDGIIIGDHVLISPGVRISAANCIRIADSCMLASNVYITDSDWHGIYDRTERDEKPTPVRVGNNVWLGDHCVILKGVTIVDNSALDLQALLSS